jgi:hypothetical protein
MIPSADQKIIHGITNKRIFFPKKIEKAAGLNISGIVFASFSHNQKNNRIRKTSLKQLNPGCFIFFTAD